MSGVPGRNLVLKFRVSVLKFTRRNTCICFNRFFHQKHEKLKLGDHCKQKHYYEDSNWNPHVYFYKELAGPLLKVTCLSLAVFYSLKYTWWLLESSEFHHTTKP